MTQKQINTRRTFSIKGQLIGKLGHQGFGQLSARLEEAAGGKYTPEQRPPAAAARKRRRRGGRGRKQQVVA